MPFNTGSAADLGHAEFKLRVNTKQFIDDMKAAADAAKASSSNIDVSMNNVELSSRKAFMGFRGLSSLSSDLAKDTANFGDVLAMASQHAERAAIAFGASGPLFIGIMGLSAVAVTFARNWDDLKDIVGRTEAFDVAGRKIEGIGDAVAAAFVDPASRKFQGDESGKRNQKIQEDIKAQHKAEEDRLKKAEASRKAQEGLRTKEQREAGKNFTENLAEYNASGGNLRDEAIKRAVGGRKVSDDVRKKIETGIDVAIADAMTGKGSVTTPGFDVFKKQKEAAQQDKIIKEQGVHDLKEAEAWEKKRRDKETAMLNKQGHELEADFRKGLQNEIMGLEEQKHQMERQRSQLTESAHEVQPMSIKSSLKDLVDSMQTDIINSVPKQQLEMAKELNRKIDTLNEEIRRQRNVARLG